MSEEELRKDILYQIDMQLYDEFNDKLAEMNDHLGDIYSLRDIEEVEKAEKEKEIKLLRETVRNLQKENEELHKEINQRIKLKLENEKIADELYNKIKNLQKELEYKDDIIHDLGTEVLPISIEGFEVLLNKTKEENDNLQKELDKKDKVIDELISEIIRIIYYYENYKQCDFEYEIKESITETREKIEQYFFKKAEEENE